MFAALGGDRWWPLTGNAVVLDAGLAAVEKAVRREPMAWTRWTSAPDLQSALDGCAPFLGSGDGDLLLAGTADGRTVALTTTTGGAAFTLRKYADKYLRCRMVGVQFLPRSLIFDGGATYLVQPARGRFGTLDRMRDVRTLQVAGGARSWDWIAKGDPLPYEDPAVVESKPLTGRLSPAVLHRYLLAEGVPVDDPGWLSGPVVVAQRDQLPDRARTWVDIADLRRQHGYVESGVPDQLTQRRGGRT